MVQQVSRIYSSYVTEPSYLMNKFPLYLLFLSSGNTKLNHSASTHTSYVILISLKTEHDEHINLLDTRCCLP